jgi:integrase
MPKVVYSHFQNFATQISHIISKGKTMGRKPKKAMGRRAGGHNKGYWYRKGRGWYASEGGQPIPLLNSAGSPLKAPDTPDDELRESYARYLLERKKKAKQLAMGDKALVLSIVVAYLDYCKANNRASTYQKRGEYLFDFCFGLPSRFWDYGNGKKVPKPKKTDYIHKGYGSKEVGQLIPMDIQQWVDKHPTWGKGTRRIAIQGLKRAMSYAVEMGLIKTNPIKGYKVQVGGKRITFFTPEQEQSLLKYAGKPLGEVIKVLIRTGARYGSELIKLTSRHVEETPAGMVWKFSAEEAKTNKPRTIYISEDIADIVRTLIKRYPTGPLFRTQKGKPWVIRNIRSAFVLLKKKLINKGIKLDKDACLYTCRHTFAKRTLGGYWTGKPATIEQLAGVMGNSRQVAWDYYGQWCDNYTEPLWQAIKGGH